MDVPYSEQLKLKDAEIAAIFSSYLEGRNGEKLKVHPILGAEDPLHYRDKVTSPLVSLKHAYKGEIPEQHLMNVEASHSARNRKTRKSGGSSKGKGRRKRDMVISGIYAKGTHKVVPVNGCPLENPVASKVVRSVREIMERHGIEPYDEDLQTGFMRHVVARVGHKSKEVLVTLVTNSEEFPHAKSFCRELVSKVGECTSIVQCINTRKTNVILGDRFKTLYGPGFILDELCGLSFRISPGAFYQVNSTQTEVLYEKAIEMASIDPSASVIDAYCGTATIGLVACSEHGNPLLGMDSSAQAIRDARQNALHNRRSNALFSAKDATELMEEACASKDAIEVPDGFDWEKLTVFMDPPRSGASERFLDAVAKLSPEKIVYISCNPRTQERDCRILTEKGFVLKEIQPVDMFPHTPHIESIALLENK